jgi:hypothetical protein
MSELRCDLAILPDGTYRCRRPDCRREFKPKGPAAAGVSLRCRGADVIQPSRPVDPFDEFPCIHRGHDDCRTALCELCGPEKGLFVPIRHCDMHGECARRKFKSGTARSDDGRPIGICLGCTDRKPPPAKCPERGELLRVVDVGNGTECAFFACRKFGECTVGDFGLPGVQACVGCGLRPT